MYLPFVIIANKAQNEIDRQVESEEEIADSLKF